MSEFVDTPHGPARVLSTGDGSAGTWTKAQKLPVDDLPWGFVGLGEAALRLWQAARIPALLLLLVFVIALLYYATPNIRQPRFRWLSIGSVVAILVMSAATTGFSFYVSNVNDYNATYGAMAA